MIDLIKEFSDFINESNTKDLMFEEFAQARHDGASKIASGAKEKGGAAMLTYQHFIVKLPYYKRAASGKWNADESQVELSKLIKELSTGGSRKIKMTQSEFQRLVGKIEVLGELLIRAKNK